jgi:hypothetical protein
MARRDRRDVDDDDDDDLLFVRRRADEGDMTRAFVDLQTMPNDNDSVLTHSFST